MRVVVMGVSGCGKSTLAAGLAQALDARFVDADDLHPAANVARMARGEALTDADRAPWLDRVAQVLADGAPVVVACSALKRAYRDRLRAAGGVRFLYLAVPRAELAARMQARKGHFMPPTLLDSQLATLEVPGPDEAVTLDGTQPPAQVLAAALAAVSGRFS